MWKRARCPLACALSALVLAACDQPADDVASSTGDSTNRPSIVVARVGETEITADDVARAAALEGLSPKQALERLVDLQVLYGHATARSPLDPRTQREGRDQVMVETFIEREIEPRLAMDRVPESYLRALYEKMAASYNRPRLLKVDIFDIYAFPKQGPARRADARRWMDELSKLIASGHNWNEIAARPEWKERGLSLGYTWQAPDGPYSAEVGSAVAQLREPGDVTAVIEDVAGFHIARYLAEKAARKRSFVEVTSEIRDAVYPIWRKQRFQELCAEISRQAGLRVNAAALAGAVPR